MSTAEREVKAIMMNLVKRAINMVAVIYGELKPPQPIQFRIPDEDGVIQTIRISKINSMREIRKLSVEGYEYLCTCRIQNHNRKVHLSYIFKDASWYFLDIF